MQDNQAFRDLFTLPPVQASTSTALAIPEMPAPKKVTGDREVDSVLWLQECVSTGHQALIDKALEASKQITTPMKDLGLRYSQYLARQHGSTFMAALGSMSFGELEAQARAAVERKQKQHVALSRFGTVEALFDDTPAEEACKKALRGLKCNKSTNYSYDEAQASERFAKKPHLQPFTLADCVYGQVYWDELYKLRCPFDQCGDSPPYAFAQDEHCCALMAELAPRSKDEALAVFGYMDEHDIAERTAGPAILRNLISGGWA